MIAPQPLQLEAVNGDFYFSAMSDLSPMWPPQNTPLWHCLSMLIAGVQVTEEIFETNIGEDKIDRLIYVLRGLGWPVKSHVALSLNDVSDESTLSYFISDADKRIILEGDA